MTALLLELPTSPLFLSRRNVASVEAMCDSRPLPIGSLTGRPDAAHVTVTSLDDLGQWMYARGGRITVHPTPHGVDLWVLHTTADGLPGAPVPVRVSVPVPAGEQTPCDFTASVAGDHWKGVA